ncbi:MAG TPA: hypothetical protein PLE54_15135 [Burkholderiaceae bacterium]|nr:hypothetical protein [Burkholderiaceae bacterium]
MLLTTPAFKAYVGREAKREGVSVAELVRRRVQPAANEDEATLVELTTQLRSAVEQAQKSAEQSLAEVEAILLELRQKKRAPARKRAA